MAKISDRFAMSVLTLQSQDGALVDFEVVLRDGGGIPVGDRMYVNMRTPAQSGMVTNVNSISTECERTATVVQMDLEDQHGNLLFTAPLQAATVLAGDTLSFSPGSIKITLNGGDAVEAERDFRASRPAQRIEPYVIDEERSLEEWLKE